MYKMKYIFGQMVKYNAQMHKILGIRFTRDGVMYKLNGVHEWVKERDISE